jgi:hypothetical protein
MACMLVVCKALLLLVKFAASFPSSGLRSGVANPVTIGEYGLTELGENDETWSNITDSSVAFVRAIIFARKADGNGCATP